MTCNHPTTRHILTNGLESGVMFCPDCGAQLEMNSTRRHRPAERHETMNAIQEAVFQHVAARLENAPAAVNAQDSFNERLGKARGELAEAGVEIMELALDLEALLNAVVSETIWAAFLEGLAFDAKALLLAAREA